MKIAQVTPYYLPVEGGVERHVFNLSRELVKRGHEVKIFTCARTRQGEPLDRRSVVDGVEVLRFESIVALGEFGRVWPGFAREVKNGGFDVVHSHAYRHPHTDLSMVVSKVSGCASVLTTHSPFHPAGVRGSLAQALVSVYDHLLAPTTLAYFDAVISLTREEAAILHRLGVPRDRTEVIPHGVDSRHFEASSPSEFRARFGLEGKEVILSLGRINRTKGLDVLLEAFHSICGVFPELALVLAGGCTSQEEERFLLELKQRTKVLGLEGRVVFTGRLNEEEKSSAFDASRVFVLPSRYEPYGLVILEAAAHAKPIIATAAGGPSSILAEGETGMLVAPEDPAQLAAALLRVLADKESAAMMGVRAKVMAREHSWERVAEMTDGVYAKVCRRGRDGSVERVVPTSHLAG